jgi:hypothetical protein
LREEILGQAAGLGIDRLWVEKVRIETEPRTAATHVAARSDAIADMHRFLEGAPDDAALLEALMEDLRPLVDKAPFELIQAVPELDAIRSGNVAGIVKSVTPGLLAYLAQSN